jgi:CheY-like chemotaxis protein
VLKALFHPFAQAQQSLARTEGGLGLGLAFVRGVVELHGGSVGVRSEGPGQGAEFTVRLPLAGSATAPRAGQAAPAAASPAERRTVLVVDDNRDGAESLAELVRLLGHDAQVVYDGRSAIERVRRAPPDVVFCNIGLPDVSGYEVARALRAAGVRRTKLFALSGYAQPEDLEKAGEAGFDGHLAKPPALEALSRALSQAPGA